MAKLTPQEAQNLHSVFEEVVNSMINATTSHFEAQAGGKISVSDKLKLSMAKKLFDMSKKFGSEAKIMKLIEVSNKVIPLVSQYVDEEAILGHVPANMRDTKTIALLDKAGAKEISALFKKLQPEVAASMVVAAPVVAAAVVLPPAPVVEAPIVEPEATVEEVVQVVAAPAVVEEDISPLSTVGRGAATSTVGRVASTTRPIASTVSTRPGHGAPRSGPR